MATKNATLVLGAGFSKPARGPLLRELLDEPYVQVSDADAIALDFLAAYVHERGGPDTYTLEDLFTEVWREAQIGGRLVVSGEAWPADKLLQEVTKHLTSLCCSIKLRRKTNLWFQYLQFFDVLYHNHAALNIISFNYDLVVERALTDLGVPYTYGEYANLHLEKKRRKASDDPVRIFKLHGSSNWAFCRGCRRAEPGNDSITVYEEEYVPKRRRPCPQCGTLMAGGIVPPIHGKAGEVRQIQAMWKEARARLSKTTHLHVIGYSLPASDHEARSLLSAVDSERLRAAVLVCGPNGAPETYQKVLPMATDAQAYLEDYLGEYLAE